MPGNQTSSFLYADDHRLVLPFLSEELHANGLAVGCSFFFGDRKGEKLLRIDDMAAEDGVDWHVSGLDRVMLLFPVELQGNLAGRQVFMTI